MSDKYMKYIGKEKGSIPGIPARDLTEKEAKDIGIQFLLQSGLYERVEEPEKPFEIKPSTMKDVADAIASEPEPEEKLYPYETKEEPKPRRKPRRKESE